MKFFCILNFNYLLCAFVAIATARRNTECPDAKSIAPCECKAGSSLSMDCKYVYSVETLKKVFENSENRYFADVSIKYSTFSYLPHEIFEWTTFGSLWIRSSTIAQLFDKPPVRSNSLESLVLGRIEFQRKFNWSDLNVFSELKSLRIDSIPLKVLDKEFGQYVTENLNMLIFEGTETRKILPGAFVKHTKLESFHAKKNLLTHVRRDSFPNPADIQVFDFSENRIERIPVDLFRDMPKLVSVNFQDNLIKLLHEFEFQGTEQKTLKMRLNGNPLECKCRLRWILDYTFQIKGKCVKPARLKGREVNELQKSDFMCIE